MDKVIHDVLCKMQVTLQRQDKELFTIEEVGLYTKGLCLAELSQMAEKNKIPSHQYQGRTYLVKSEILDLLNQDKDADTEEYNIKLTNGYNFFTNEAKKIFKELLQIKKVGLLQERELLTLEDVVVLTNLSKGCILGLVLDNKIPYHEEGGKVYFTKSEIKEWMKFSPYYLELWTKKNL